MDNGFGVALGTKTMTALLEFFLELAIVVDFSIEHNEYTLIFIKDRLLAACHVNNREAAHAKGDSIPYPYSLIIWSSVTNHCAHALYQPLGALTTLRFINQSSNTTHSSVL